MPRYMLTKDKFLNEVEYQKLVSHLEQFKYKGHVPLRALIHTRNILLIYVALQTGARATEILNIRLRDLDSLDQTVHIRGIKNSDDRDIPLNTNLFTRLIDYANSQSLKESDKIFDVTYQRLFQIWHSIRTTPKKFHSLRHTFAIRVYQRTKDAKLVQQALGHRSFNNTMIYLQFSRSKQEMRRLLIEDDATKPT